MYFFSSYEKCLAYKYVKKIGHISSTEKKQPPLHSFLVNKLCLTAYRCRNPLMVISLFFNARLEQRVNVFATRAYLELVCVAILLHLHKIHHEK